METFLKICGITTVEDAAAAVDAGADVIGLMFHEPSPRFVDLDAARRISESTPTSISKVGVFVNASVDFVHEAITECGLNVAQFHGDESPEYCSRFPVRVWKAFRVRDEASLNSLGDYGTDAWLLDSYVKGRPGGTGERFNWDLAVAAKENGVPIVLAGGLTAENAPEAVRRVAPYGLDFSSGVEREPGIKDHDRMKDFVRAVRDV